MHEYIVTCSYYEQLSIAMFPTIFAQHAYTSMGWPIHVYGCCPTSLATATHAYTRIHAVYGLPVYPYEYGQRYSIASLAHACCYTRYT